MCFLNAPNGILKNNITLAISFCNSVSHFLDFLRNRINMLNVEIMRGFMRCIFVGETPALELWDQIEEATVNYDEI